MANYTRKRFGAKATVDAGTKYRTAQRVEALGFTPKGVDASDGISGKEARLVKYARRRQKAKRIGTRSYRRYLKGSS